MQNIKKHSYFKSLPLIAILRGILPAEILSVAKVLYEEGYRFIEVPLNSPNALDSIKLLVDEYGDTAVVGAGTVTNTRQLLDVLKTGAKLIVTPNMNTAVISLARDKGCIVIAGIQTVTEAFDALASGASAIKIFPAEIIGAKGVKAIKSVLPKDAVCIPVGGVLANKNSIQEYLTAGADGFGFAGGLYQSGMSLTNIRKSCRAYKKAFLSCNFG